MKTKAGFVPDLVLPRVERLRDELARLGLPLDKYSWVADALLSSGCLPDDEDAFELLRLICTSAFVHWKRFDDRDGTVLVLLKAINMHISRGVRLIEHPITCEHWRITPDASTKFIVACVAQGVDFTNALLTTTRHHHATGTPKGRARLGTQDARTLSEYGVLQPERLCDVGRLEMLADTVDWQFDSWPPAGTDEELADATSPTFWMAVGAEQFLQCLLPLLETTDDHTASRLAHGVAVTIKRMLHAGLPPEPRRQIRLAVFQNLDRRVGPEPRNATDSLRRAWMRLSLELYGGFLGDLDEMFRDRITAAADFELGRLRADLKHASSDDGADTLNRLLPTIEASVHILFQLSSPWNAMRPLLLVLRDLKAPAVAPDMRYWSDEWHTPDAPLPWSRIPEMLVSLFHAFANQEQDHDSALTDLRTKFGKFCLARLKSKDDGGPPIEPDSRWRWAYVRAARELRINPEGKGHHVLNHAMRSDQDQDVQEEAKEAYTEMRHGPRLPIGYSPRRTVTNALVWLFQAHYLSVAPPGVPIDRNGVQRTREEIARRTKEPKLQPSVEPSSQ